MRWTNIKKDKLIGLECINPKNGKHILRLSPNSKNMEKREWDDSDARIVSIIVNNKPTLLDIKNYLLSLQKEYDSSAEVNCFILNNKRVWLDKATRVGLFNVLNLEKSNRGKKFQKQRAIEYFEGNLPENFRKLALDLWETHLQTASQIVTILTFLIEETKKDELFFEKLKYTLLHFEEYEILYKEVSNQKRIESQKITFEKREIETKEQRDKIIDKIVAENPNHSTFWYKEFLKEYWQKKYFKVTLVENKHLLSIAYRYYPHNLGYTDFRNFFSLNKLSIIEYLEKNKYITF